MHPIGIILTAHGELAPALLHAAELSLGPQPGVVAVRLAPQDGPEANAAALQAALAQVDGGSGVLVLADLFGGTPASTAALVLARRPYALLSGVNLPMVLEALSSRAELALRELAAAALQAGRDGVVDVGARLASECPAGRAADLP